LVAVIPRDGLAIERSRRHSRNRRLCDGRPHHEVLELPECALDRRCLRSQRHIVGLACGRLEGSQFAPKTFDHVLLGGVAASGPVRGLADARGDLLQSGFGRRDIRDSWGRSGKTQRASEQRYENAATLRHPCRICGHEIPLPLVKAAIVSAVDRPTNRHYKGFARNSAASSRARMWCTHVVNVRF